MSERWTPGPWSEHGKGGCECGQIFGPDGNAVIAIVQGPKHLSMFSPDCVPNSAAQQANARLIAAAPDLAEAAALQEAAEEAKSNCEECYPEDAPESCPSCFPLFDAARQKRRAALAKARSEE